MGAEASNEWHNAGTGHAAFCEANYTPVDPKTGEVDISKREFSLSPPLHRGACAPAPRAAVMHSKARDGAQPSVRWSCPALVMGAADSRLLRAGGFCSQAPLKRLHEQAFDIGALLRMST